MTEKSQQIEPNIIHKLNLNVSKSVLKLICGWAPGALEMLLGYKQYGAMAKGQLHPKQHGRIVQEVDVRCLLGEEKNPHPKTN